MSNGHKTPIAGRVSETRFSLLEQRVGGIETALNTLSSRIETWMQARQRSPWQFIALLLAILVPLGWIFNVYITSAISPVNATAVQSLATANTNTGSITHLVENQSRMMTTIAENDAERRANEREVETQVDALSQMYNEKIAEIFRRVQDNQNAVHDMGGKMPQASTGPYFFPNISNRNHRDPKTSK